MARRRRTEDGATAATPPSLASFAGWADLNAKLGTMGLDALDQLLGELTSVDPPARAWWKGWYVTQRVHRRLCRERARVEREALRAGHPWSTVRRACAK